MANKFDAMFSNLAPAATAPAVAPAAAAPAPVAAPAALHTGAYRRPDGSTYWNPPPGAYEADYPPGAPAATPAIEKAPAKANKFDAMFSHLAPDNSQAAATAQSVAQLGEPSDGPETPAIANKGDLGAKPGEPGSPGNLDTPGNASFVDGALFGAGDEISAAINGFGNAVNNGLLEKGVQGIGENYAQSLAANRAQLAWEKENMPAESTALELGGALATAPFTGAGKVLEGAGLVNKSIRAAGLGAGLGGFQAAASNDGTLADRVAAVPQGAATGALIGAATPAAGRIVGAPASALYQKVADYAANREAAAAASKVVPASREALAKVGRAFSDDVKTGNLNQNPAPADMLMNTGDQMGAQAGALATTPGEAQNVVTSAIRTQKAGAGARVAQAADTALGSDAGRVADAASVEAERKAAGKMYDVARASGAVVNIRPARAALARAVEQADGSMRTSLEKLSGLRAFSNDNLWKGANAADIHSARMVIDDEMRKAGQGTNEARLLGKVRASLDDALKGGNGQKGIPGYAQADAAYKEVLDSRNALEEGRKVFSRGFGSPDELQKELSGMSPKVLDAFTKGARDYVSELMGTARNDAGAVIRELNAKGWNREKLDVLLGPQKSQQMLGDLEAEAKRQGLADTILGNSKTAKTQAAQKEFANPATKEVDANSLRGATLTGLVLSTLSKGFNSIRASAASKSANQINKEVANLLTSTGVKRDQITRILSTATRKKNATLTAVERINALATGLGVAGGNAAIAAR